MGRLRREWIEWRCHPRASQELIQREQAKARSGTPEELAPGETEKFSVHRLVHVNEFIQRQHRLAKVSQRQALRGRLPSRRIPRGSLRHEFKRGAQLHLSGW